MVKMSANLLTILRIILVFSMLPFLYYNFSLDYHFIQFNKILFGIIFILASFTDYLDGFIARKFKQKTVFGKFFDPIADKILVFISFIYIYILCQKNMLFINFPQINQKLEYFILSVLITNNLRDFLIMGVRFVAFEQKMLIESSIFGKIKTFFIFISFILVLFVELWIKILNIEDIIFFINFIKLVLIINIIFTILSGLDYIIKNYKIIFSKLV
ncbi:hypothetical protein DH96_00020 [Candidatus Phytoplasma oryzae]|uniref:CDP-diacylglycerol--glycerol-3-phosphate 3-phosphatidyltransferase n=1 Tax=Candidatus Phytoplasma oryzae TaxID=203274 RepID=A0A328ILU9_9MOLU|nr:hypothetical protein DH96_00020 [Candidatus Phytoplasma oryzae]